MTAFAIAAAVLVALVVLLLLPPLLRGRAVSRASGPVRWRMARRGVSGSCSIFSTPRLPTRTRVTDFCIPHSSRW